MRRCRWRQGQGGRGHHRDKEGELRGEGCGVGESQGLAMAEDAREGRGGACELHMGVAIVDSGNKDNVGVAKEVDVIEV